MGNNLKELRYLALFIKEESIKRNYKNCKITNVKKYKNNFIVDFYYEEIKGYPGLYLERIYKKWEISYKIIDEKYIFTINKEDFSL